MKEKKIEAWERQPDEGEKPFEAFCIYRDLGKKRTIIAVAEQLQKSDTLIRRWMKAYNWRERVTAYDNSLEKKAHDAAVSEAQKVRRNQIGIAATLEQKALEALKNLDAEQLTPRDIKEMLKLAWEVEDRHILQREPPSVNSADMSLADFISAAYKKRMEQGDDEQ